MNAELAALLANGAPSKEAVDGFLDGREVPLVDDSGLTFLWRGEATSVRLQHWIAGLPSTEPFERVEGTDLWWHEVALPPESRVEYKLHVTQGDVHRLVADPLNPHLATDPFGANSVAASSGYARPAWTLPDPRVRRGSFEVDDVPSAALGGTRRVTTYLPARFRRRARYPLLIVHDGTDYLHHAALRDVLDHLIDVHEIPPLIAACVDPGDRLVEYAADERHTTFIADELLPWLQERLPLVDRPDARGLVGASFGGVASLSTAYRRPGLFGRLLLQSGSFAFTDIGEHDRGPLFDPVVAFMNGFREDPGRFTEKVFLSCGTYERLIYENRSLAPKLAEAGLDVRLEEARDGHNWENWRDRLRTGLSWLFPGPLWMVYE